MLGLGDGTGGLELDDVADLELVVGAVRLVLVLDALPALVLVSGCGARRTTSTPPSCPPWSSPPASSAT